MRYTIKYKNSVAREIVIAQSTLKDGNMSFARGGIEDTIANRRRFLENLGLELENLTAAGLIHGTTCCPVNSTHKGRGALTLDDAISETDALIATEDNLILAVTTADCLPLFIWNDEAGVIGIAHAGWKGLAEGIVRELIKSMLKLHKLPLNRFHCLIGASVGPCCYIVDAERLKKFAAYPFCEIHYREGEKVHLDLRKIARIALNRQGIPLENIEIFPQCTACGNEYPSHRRDGDSFITDIALIVKRPVS